MVKCRACSEQADFTSAKFCVACVSIDAVYMSNKKVVCILKVWERMVD